MPKIRAQVRIEYSRRQMLGTHQPQAQHTGNALQELLDSSDGLRALRTWNMDGWRWHRRRRSCLDQSDYAHLARTTHSANASAQACICRFYSCTCTCLLPGLVLAAAAPFPRRCCIVSCWVPLPRSHTSACSSNASAAASWKTMESTSAQQIRWPPCPG